MLICIAGIFQFSSQYNEEEELNNVYQNITSDYQVFGRFVEAQVAPATEWDSIPAIGWLQPPGTPEYRIKRCKRVNVMNCTRGKYLNVWFTCVFPTLLERAGITLALLLAAGNPKLPKEFQGAYWQDGIIWDEVRCYILLDCLTRAASSKTWSCPC